MKLPKFVRKRLGSSYSSTRKHNILEATSPDREEKIPERPSLVSEIEVETDSPRHQTPPHSPSPPKPYSPERTHESVKLDLKLERLEQEHIQERNDWEEERSQLQQQLDELEEKAILATEKAIDALARADAAEKRKRSVEAEMKETLQGQMGGEEHANMVAKLALAELQKMRKDLEDLRGQVKSEASGVKGWVAGVQEELGTRLEETNALEYKAKKYDVLREQNKTLYNQIQDFRGNIRVFCRVRPEKADEELAVNIHEMDTGFDQIEVMDKQRQWKSYTFDKVLRPEVSQAAVYDEVKPLLRSVLDGFPVCIFAYGQTSSGKTYTMSGPAADEGFSMPSHGEEKGITYRALDDLFALAEDRSGDTRYTMHVQMLEIYNEQIRDLLVKETDEKDKDKVRFVDGVPNTHKVAVHSSKEVVSVMDEGHRNRAVGATTLNLHSSRSHSVVTIGVDAQNILTGEVVSTKLQLVDLAGSERVGQSQAQGERLKEAQYINKSLSALGDVVSALQNKNPHVPFRNSRLTTVLQDSLGGGAKTIMLLHISPEVASQQESLSTLQFGVRAASVERPAQVKSSPAAPLNSVQMKKTLEDLSIKNKEIDTQKANIQKITSEAQATARELEEKNTELRKVQLELRHRNAKLEQSQSEVSLLKNRIAALEAANSKVESSMKVLRKSNSRESREGVPNRFGYSAGSGLKRRDSPASSEANGEGAAAAVAANGKSGKSKAEIEEQVAWGDDDDGQSDEEYHDAGRNLASLIISPASGTVRDREPLYQVTTSSSPLSKSSTPSTAGKISSGIKSERSTPEVPTSSRRPATSTRDRPLSARDPPRNRPPTATPGSQTVRDRFSSDGTSSVPAKPTATPGTRCPPRPTPPSRPISATSKSTSSLNRPKSVPPQSKYGRDSTSASTSRVGSKTGTGASSSNPLRASTSKTTPRSTSTTAVRGGGAWAPPPSNKPTTRKHEKEEKPKEVKDLKSIAAVTSDSLEWSKMKEKEAMDKTASSRKDAELKKRHEKLKKAPPKESKIKHINDFDTLLQEAEKQLARLSNEGAEAGENDDNGGFIDDISSIAKKIDKAEEEASSSGALDGKNEKEARRLITLFGKLQGQLESDDIASANTESRLEKQRQIKRCKTLTSSLEMAGMSVSWSGGGGWGGGWG